MTIEEHNVLGGLGGVVAEVFTRHVGMPKLLRLGVRDCFNRACDYEGLLEQNRLTDKQVFDDIMATLG